MAEHLEIDESEDLLRSKPMSQYEALQLIQPLREAFQDLLISFIDVTAALVKSSEGESREELMKGFEKLGPCFDGVGEFDLRVQRLINGLDIADSSTGAPMEGHIDE